mgnify:CR=1 FL=1
MLVSDLYFLKIILKPNLFFTKYRFIVFNNCRSCRKVKKQFFYLEKAISLSLIKEINIENLLKNYLFLKQDLV